MGIITSRFYLKNQFGKLLFLFKSVETVPFQKLVLQYRTGRDTKWNKYFYISWLL